MTTGTDLIKAQVSHVHKLVTSYQANFAAMVPAHIKPDAFVELAIAYVKRDRDLLQAAHPPPQSLILVLRQCGALGHLPLKGTFSLVAFNDKNAPGGKAIVGMEEWRGVVERIWRAGGVESVHVNVGRDNDPVCRFNPTEMALPYHKYDEFASPAQRGPLKVVYAWCRMRGGGVSQVAWLPRYEVNRHRAMSRTATKAGGGGGAFWGPEDGEGPNTEPMWKKTALHVLEGFVPTSSAYREHVAVAEAAAQGWQGIPDQAGVAQPYSGNDYMDGEVVDAPEGGWPATPAAGSGATVPKDKAGGGNG